MSSFWMSQSGVVILATFLVFSVFDIIKKNDNFQNLHDEDHLEEESSIREKKPIDDKNVYILYCVSCGYRQAFEKYSNLAETKFPDLQIHGDNYSPGFWKSTLAQGLGLLRWVLLVVIMTGINPFEWFGLGYPSLLQGCHLNKISSSILILFLENFLESFLMSTGAFEIYFRNRLVWSKIVMGRVPSEGEFVELLNSALENK